MRKEKMEEPVNKEAKVGWRYAGDPCCKDHRRKKQAVRIANTRRMESLWHLTAILEQSLAQKKVQ